MKNLITILAISLFISACGSPSKEADPFIWKDPFANTSYSSSASGNFTVINPTSKPIQIQVEPDLTAKSKKTEKIASNQMVDEDILNPGSTAIVAGCVDAINKGGSIICFENDVNAIKTANDLAYTDIQSKVETWAGDTGNPEILIIKNPAGKHGGIHDGTNNRIILVSGSTPEMFAHELTHAAYFNIRKTTKPLWLNEAIAVWSETAVTSGEYREGIMTPALTSWNSIQSDYVRSSYIARYIQSIQLMPINQALYSADTLKALTGMDLSEFTTSFYSQNFANYMPSESQQPWINLPPNILPATAETTEIPAFGAVLVNGTAHWNDGGIMVKK